MSDFAILKADQFGTERVVNKIVSEYPFAQQLVLNGEADRVVQLFTDDQRRDVAIGSTYDPATGVFTPPYDAMTLEQAKAQRKREIASARWNEQMTPATVTGYSEPFYTDKESIGDMLSACDDMKNAIAIGEAQATDTIEWKTAGGVFVNVTLENLVTIRLLLAQRKQSLYAKEAAKCAAIDAAQTVEDVEAVAW